MGIGRFEGVKYFSSARYICVQSDSGRRVKRDVRGALSAREQVMVEEVVIVVVIVVDIFFF